ncbi:MAG: lysophospholipid acyltransferase family protein [Candidatus Omnitrophota bacterium]
MIFYLLYKFGHFLANTLSIKHAYFVAERFSDVQCFLSRKDRRAVQENLSKVLNKKPEECLGLARKAFRNFGLYLVDFFRVTQYTKEDFKKRVKIVGLENVDNVLKQGRGVIVLSAHLGNWEIAGIAMGARGYDISAVTLNHKHKNIDDFFIDQREKKGMKVITMNSAMKKCVSCLRKAGLLALLGDRDFTDSGVMLKFFGKETSIPKGPVLLSLKTNAAIIPGFGIRTSRFDYTLFFEEPLDIKVDESLDKREAIKEAVKATIPIMEKYIKKYPEQWLVFRRFWEKIEDPMAL